MNIPKCSCFLWGEMLQLNTRNKGASVLTAATSCATIKSCVQQTEWGKVDDWSGSCSADESETSHCGCQIGRNPRGESACLGDALPATTVVTGLVGLMWELPYMSAVDSQTDKTVPAKCEGTCVNYPGMYCNHVVIPPPESVITDQAITGQYFKNAAALTLFQVWIPELLSSGSDFQHGTGRLGILLCQQLFSFSH